MFKNVNIMLAFVLCVTYECSGQLGLLKDIVGGAHEHIHSTVEKVTGGLLGGLNLNFQGHLGIGGQRYPPKPAAPANGQQTVIVVVQENDDSNENSNMRPHQYGQTPYNNNHQNGYQPQNQGQWNGNYNANQNPYGNQNHDRNQYGNQNYGNNGRPNQGQNNFSGQRPSQNDQEHQNNYGNEGNRPNENVQGNYGQDHQQGNNQHHDYEAGNENEKQTTPQGETRPTFGSIHEEPTQTPIAEKTTNKDEPLFVPLNPNQYMFGDDKSPNNAPKREAENDQEADDKDDVFPIDIRLQDQ